MVEFCGWILEQLNLGRVTNRCNLGLGLILTNHDRKEGDDDDEDDHDDADVVRAPEELLQM